MTATVATLGQVIVYERLSHGWWYVHCSHCGRGIAGSRNQMTECADAHECEEKP